MNWWNQIRERITDPDPVRAARHRVASWRRAGAQLVAAGVCWVLLGHVAPIILFRPLSPLEFALGVWGAGAALAALGVWCWRRGGAIRRGL